MVRGWWLVKKTAFFTNHQPRTTYHLHRAMPHWLSNPIALWLLAVMPILTLLGWLARRHRARAVARLGSSAGASSALAVRDPWAAIRAVCWSGAIALVVVGIAGPQWGREWVQAAAGRDIVVVLDMSRSMLAEQPTRFQRAKAALVDLSHEVQKRGGHRLGLVVFAGGARIACPLTHDYDHFREVLEQLDADELPEELRPESGGSGTRIGAGLREAVLAAHDERYRGFQDILLISDGDDPARDEEWRGGISAARERGIPVHTIGVGDPDRAHTIPSAGGPLVHGDKLVQTKLEGKPLEEIARLTGGTYTAAGTKALPLGELFRARIEPRAGRDDEDGLGMLQVYRQRYAWFLGPALALFTVEMALGRSRSSGAQSANGTPLPRPSGSEEGTKQAADR